MNAVTAVIGSCALAALAAAIGRYNTDTRRAARRDRRETAIVAELRALNLRKARLTVAGRLSSDPNAWTVFWATHGLDQVQPGTDGDA